MKFQNFGFKTDEKNMENEKIPNFFFDNFFYLCLKTPNPGSFSRAHDENPINLSILEIDFRDFPLYFNRICLPGSGAENLFSLGNYCRTAHAKAPWRNTLPAL